MVVEWAVLKLLVEILKFPFKVIAFIIIFVEEEIWHVVKIWVVDKIRLPQKIETWIKAQNRWIIACLFIPVYLSIKLLSIKATVLFLQEQYAIAMLVFISAKGMGSPIVIWLWTKGKHRLLTFVIVAFVYGYLIKGVDWVKSSRFYIITKRRLIYWKLQIKRRIRLIKKWYGQRMMVKDNA